VRTDFILSAEIITITLGTVAQSKLQTQVAVLCLVALLMTVGVYGLVAAIVKLDDAGLALARLDGRRPAARALRALGGVLLRATPWVMRSLGVAGTVAMFLVGGGILVHGVPPLHTAIEHSARTVGAWPTVGGALAALLPLALDAVVGIAAGTLALAGVRGVQRLRPGNSQ
jgi:predicted DNA repair protein MutK